MPCVSRAILSVFLPAAAFAAQTVEGRVFNAVNGVDVPGVIVNLIQAGEVAYSATTGVEGRFRIAAVKPGAYTAHYSARGFWSVPNFLVDEDFERECGRCFLAERGGLPFQVAAGDDSVRL